MAPAELLEDAAEEEGAALEELAAAWEDEGAAADELDSGPEDGGVALEDPTDEEERVSVLLERAAEELAGPDPDVPAPLLPETEPWLDPFPEVPPDDETPASSVASGRGE